jgi:hypothetical protein
VLCLVPAGYATLSGPLPAADTALMRTRIDSTLGGSITGKPWAPDQDPGWGTLMGLGAHPVGWVHNWPPKYYAQMYQALASAVYQVWGAPPRGESTQ